MKILYYITIIYKYFQFLSVKLTIVHYQETVILANFIRFLILVILHKKITSSLTTPCPNRSIKYFQILFINKINLPQKKIES